LVMFSFFDAFITTFSLIIVSFFFAVNKTLLSKNCFFSLLLLHFGESFVWWRLSSDNLAL
jgi:hypothetical protein